MGALLVGAVLLAAYHWVMQPRRRFAVMLDVMIEPHEWYYVSYDSDADNYAAARADGLRQCAAEFPDAREVIVVSVAEVGT